MVNNSDTKVSYQGNGQTTVFPFSFPFIQRDYIKVAIYDSLTDETKTIDSDYYVDTVANTVIYPGYEPGQEPAEALRPPILPATSTITIYRQTDVDQLTDLGEKYPLKDIENMADKLTEIIQEQAETLGRTVKVPVGDPKTPEEKLTDLQNYVSDAANSAKNAADSEASAQRAAEAAATSEANAAESERLAGGYADTATAAASRAEDSAISARAYNAPDYDNAKTYQAGEVVTFTDGNSYKALQETTGHEPPNIIYWQKVTDYVGDNFFEIDEYGYIVPMDSPSHSRYWRVDQNGYIVPIEGGDGGYRPDTRSLSAEYLNVTNEGYIKHLRADDVNAGNLSATGNVTAGMLTTPQANVTTLTANAVNAGTVAADDIIAKGPIVDVRAFGAKGDGVTDDTAAIQAAIDYAELKNLHDVYVPGGIYKISSVILLPSYTWLHGDGDNTQIIADSVNWDNTQKSMIKLKKMLMTGADQEKDVSVSDLLLNTNGVDVIGQIGVIGFTGLQRGRIDNVHIIIDGDGAWGINLFSSNKDVNVNKCTIENNSDEGKTGGCIWVRSGMAVSGYDDRKTYGISVTNCVLKSTAVDELLCVSDGVDGGWTEAIISNCTLIGNASTTLPNFLSVFHSRSAQSHVRVSVTNCDISGKATLFAMLLGYENNSDEDSFAEVVSNININMTSGGGVRSFLVGHTIDNCHIVAPGDYGVYYCTAFNCKIIGKARVAKLYNCDIKTTAENGETVYNSYVVKNCKILSAGTGIKAQKGFSGGQYVGNEISAPNYGIQMEWTTDGGGKDTVIRGNYLYRPTASDNTNSTAIDVSYGKNILLSDNAMKLHTTAGNSVGFQTGAKTFGSTNLVSGEVLYINV